MTEIERIELFFSAFSKRDAHGMNGCYSEDIAFHDPMFDLLRGEEVRAMWRMLMGNAKDFKLEFGNIQDLGEGYYTGDWTASYRFSKTGRRVINKAKAHMKIEDGLITEHSDAWSLHKWSAQAIGFLGSVLGWSGLLRRRIKNDARRTLLRFIENEKCN